MISILKNFKFWFVCTPYFWLVAFFFIPLAIIMKISLSVSERGMPPYKDILAIDEVTGNFIVNITSSNYAFIFSDFFYLQSYLNSLSLAFTSTLICLIIGYPIAFM